LRNKARTKTLARPIAALMALAAARGSYFALRLKNRIDRAGDRR